MTTGRTAAGIIAWDAAPCQDAPAGPEMTELNEAAAEANSPTRPAPPSIRTEVMPDGNTEKFISLAFHQLIIEWRAA
jgi:hypothetical protein